VISPLVQGRDAWVVPAVQVAAAFLADDEQCSILPVLCVGLPLLRLQKLAVQVQASPCVLLIVAQVAQVAQGPVPSALIGAMVQPVQLVQRY
jgi:hypothetical protein